MKIGIFGGCFNPPHNMHKKIATKLINNGYLDNIIFIPTGNNYITQKRSHIITLATSFLYCFSMDIYGIFHLFFYPLNI